MEDVQYLAGHRGEEQKKTRRRPIVREKSDLLGRPLILRLSLGSLILVRYYEGDDVAPQAGWNTEVVPEVR